MKEKVDMSNLIHPSSFLGENVKLGRDIIIEENVTIGNNVIIGHRVIIYQGTKIGSGSVIADHTILGKSPQYSSFSTAKKELKKPLEIGENSKIGAKVIISAGTKIESGITIGDMAFIRERCTIGKNSAIGHRVTIENDVAIGEKARIQTGAYITAYTTIENGVFIAPLVVTTNDNYMGRRDDLIEEMKGPYIKKGARIGAAVILLPRVVIGEEAFIGAGSVVTKNIPPYKLAVGIPARVIRDVTTSELGKKE